jgi:hypothetical protein
MSCSCSKLSPLIKVDAHPEFIGHLEKLETGNWVRLCRCRECGQHWRVNEWDKYQVQFAVKITDVPQWKEFDSTPLQKRYLLEKRGGVTDEIYNWAGCGQHRVKGVAYCVDHLYETGARE